eukprot:s181_g34.t1
MAAAGDAAPEANLQEDPESKMEVSAVSSEEQVPEDKIAKDCLEVVRECMATWLGEQKRIDNYRLVAREAEALMAQLRRAERSAKLFGPAERPTPGDRGPEPSETTSLHNSAASRMGTELRLTVGNFRLRSVWHGERSEDGAQASLQITVQGSGGPEENLVEFFGRRAFDLSEDEAKYLVDHDMACSPATVGTSLSSGPLRLGAGCGLLGLGLSRLGCEVVLTEQHVAMENLLRNVEAANKSLPEDFVPAQALELDWGSEANMTAVRSKGSFDLVVGTDIVFASRLVQPLILTIRTLLKGSPSATCWLCLQRRDPDAHALLLVEAEKHFRVKEHSFSGCDGLEAACELECILLCLMLKGEQEVAPPKLDDEASVVTCDRRQRKTRKKLKPNEEKASQKDVGATVTFKGLVRHAVSLQMFLAKACLACSCQPLQYRSVFADLPGRDDMDVDLEHLDVPVGGVPMPPEAWELLSIWSEVWDAPRFRAHGLASTRLSREAVMPLLKLAASCVAAVQRHLQGRSAALRVPLHGASKELLVAAADAEFKGKGLPDPRRNPLDFVRELVHASFLTGDGEYADGMSEVRIDELMKTCCEAQLEFGKSLSRNPTVALEAACTKLQEIVREVLEAPPEEGDLAGVAGRWMLAGQLRRVAEDAALLVLTKREQSQGEIEVEADESTVSHTDQEMDNEVSKPTKEDEDGEPPLKRTKSQVAATLKARTLHSFRVA